MLKEIENILSAIADVKLSTEIRPDLDGQYRLVPFRNSSYFFYVNKSLDYKTVFHLKSNLESLLLRFEQLEEIADEHALLSAEIKAMRDATHPDSAPEIGVSTEFEFLQDFNIKYALFREGQLVTNAGLSPFTLATAQNRLLQNNSFELFIKRGELVGYKTDVFCLVFLSQKQLNDSIKDVLQAKLWWLTRAHKQATSELDVIFNTFPDLYFRIDNDGLILDYKVPDYIDLSPDVLNKPLSNILINGEVKALFTQALEQVQETKASVNIEYPILIKGQPRFREARFAPLHKTQIIIIIRDITERKKAEDAQRKSEAQYRMLAENSVDMIWTTDVDLNFTYVSPSAKAHLGYADKEFEAFGLKDILTPASFNKAAHMAFELLTNIRESPTMENLLVTRTVETENIHKNGSIIPMETKASFLLNDDNEPVGIIGISRDITERKRTERELERYREHLEEVVAERTTFLQEEIKEHEQTMEALQVSEERLRTLINSTPDIICFKDGNGRWLEANDADLELFALTDVDYRDKTDLELAEFTDPIYKEAFLGCEVSDEETWESASLMRGVEIIPTVDGEEKVYDIVKVPLFEQDGSRKGLVVLGRDITERDRTERELQKYRERLEELVEERTAALANEVEQHQQARATLQESEERYRSIVEHSQSGILILDDKYRFVYVNDEACRMTGYKRDELVGTDFRSLLAEESVQFVSDLYLRRQRGEDVPSPYEFTVIRKDAEKIYCEATSATFVNSDGHIRSVAQILDITDRKNAEREIIEAKNALSLSQQIAKLGSWELDLAAQIITLSPEHQLILGEKQQTTSMDLFAYADKYIVPEDIAIIQERLQFAIEQIENEEYHDEFEYRLKTQDGGVRYLEVTSVFKAKGIIYGATQDITVSKNADIKIRQSEVRFRNIFETAPDGITILDQKGVITDVNLAASHIYKRPIDDLIGQHVANFVLSPFKNVFRQDANPRFQKNKKHEAEIQIINAEGTVVDIWRKGSPLFDDDEYKGVLVYDRDISERKRAEIRLRQADSIIRTSPAVAFMSQIDDKSRLEFISDNVVDLLGYTAEELISGKIATDDLIHPDDIERMRESLYRCVQDSTCQNVMLAPYRMICRDGHIKWIDDRTHIIRDEEGKVVNLQGVLLDISRLKKVENDLRIKRQQAETLQTAVEALSSTLDLQRIFEIILNELRKVIPYDRASIQQIKGEQIEIVSCIGFPNIEEIIGTTFDLTDTDNPNCQVVQTNRSLILNDDGESWSNQNGTFSTRSWLGVPLLFGNNAIGMLTLDKQELNFYTEEHGRLAMTFAAQAAVAIDNARLFDEAKQAKLEAIKASDLKSRFLAGVSHELRTPLGSILGYSELLHDGILGPVTDKQKEVTKKVVDSSNYLASLVSDLLEHAQIESGNIDLTMTSVNVNELLVNVQSKIDVLAVAKGLTLEIHRDADVPAEFLGDERRLQQILINLLGNAVKFSNTGNIALRVKYKELHIIFEVEDNGIGISPEAQTYIFDSFRQVKDSRIIQKQAGTGLGLPIARQLAVAMGGDIIVESIMGEGSTFSVILPITQE